MRFLPSNRKSQLWSAAMWFLLAPMQFLGWSYSRHHWLAITLAAVFLFDGVVSIWSYFYTYWELQPHALYECRPFRRRRIPYAEILSVKPSTVFGASNQFRLEWDAHRSNGKPGRMYLNPADREAFFSVLRERAPQKPITTSTILLQRSPQSPPADRA